MQLQHKQASGTFRLNWQLKRDLRLQWLCLWGKRIVTFFLKSQFGAMFQFPTPYGITAVVLPCKSAVKTTAAD